MSENLFNSSHKATNEPYREGYDAVFRAKPTVIFIDEAGVVPQEAWDRVKVKKGQVTPPAVWVEQKCQE